MPEFISNTLTHWTGRAKSDDVAFKIVADIISSRKLFLTYCPTYPNLDEKNTTIMVCFTDIPLNFSAQHCSEFGKFGVGFNKLRFTQYGANPVFYTTSKFNHKMSFLMGLIHTIKKEKAKNLVEIVRLDPDSLPKPFEPEPFRVEELDALEELVGYFQNYQYSDSKVDYYQREWRINYPSLVENKFGAMSPAYIPGERGLELIGKKVINSMAFDYNDVDYVVVPKLYESRTQELIKNLGQGIIVKVYEDEVEID